MVTDRSRCDGEDRLVEIVGLAAQAGVHLVQVREKDLEAKALCDLVRRCVAAVRGTTTRVLVNDRLDVALAAGAHGVHLPASGVPAARARAVSPPGFLIGRSVHAAEEARQVVAGRGVDYLLFGAVFRTASKPVVPAGLEALRDAAAAVPVPVLAIGGVTVENVRAVASSGAAGLAAIGLFAEAARGGPKSLQTIVAQASLAFDTPGRVP
jgi:thiamine-phosphate diphosphorylase